MRVRALLTAAAAIAGVVAGAPGAPAAPGGWTTYEATSVPLPVPGFGCQLGADGAHVHEQPVVAPRAGVLEVEVLADGDWDVALVDDLGKHRGYGGFSRTLVEPMQGERAFRRVAARERTRVAVCQVAGSGTTATVRWRVVPEAPAGAAKGYRALNPGALPDLRERVPVQLVLLGYEGELDARELVDELPRVNRPRERIPAFYGHHEPIGITWTYDYRVIRTDRPYEDRFFRYLRGIGRPAPVDQYQQQYNDQQGNTQVVTDPLRIDAPKVEEWLGDHPPAGVDPSLPTVVLVNWWGRSDFRFHVYDKRGEPWSGTENDVGAQPYAGMLAWGGTPGDDPETGGGATRRLWFHDWSAGPEAWTYSWSVDDATGAAAGRLLPVWEYDDDGAEDPDSLTEDLAKVVRHVAVDLLITSSPLYGLQSQAPLLPVSVDLDVDRVGVDPAGSRPPLDTKELARSVGGLSPLLRVTADDQAVPFDDPRHVACIAEDAAVTVASGAAPVYEPVPGCYPEHRYPSFANPFVHAAATLDRLLDDEGRVEREIPLVSYDLPTSEVRCLAYADDNHVDGTPSMVFAFLDDCGDRIGLTDILVHEAGHAFGMSHPHDGYDYEQDEDFGTFGRAYVGAGDMVNSVMTYLAVNNDYSQFDRDNHARFLTAAHLQQANAVAAKLPARGRAASLRAADDAAASARAHFAAHRYASALREARRAYSLVLARARAAGVDLTPSTAATDLLPRGAGVPAQGAYARAHVYDPEAPVLTECRRAACLEGAPAWLRHDHGSHPH